MKKADTLADLALRESYCKHSEGVPPFYRNLLNSAKRFVLDDNASSFLADLSYANFGGGLLKSTRAIEHSRVLARLPHHTTWIEYSPQAFHRRAVEAYFDLMSTPDGQPVTERDHTLLTPRTGWLLYPYLKSAAEFHNATQFCAVFLSWLHYKNENPYTYISPYTVLWSTTDEPLRIKTRSPGEEFSEQTKKRVMLATGIPGYESDKIAYAENELTNICHARGGADILRAELNGSCGELRKVLTLLAAINDIPVGIKHIETTHGFVAQGRYRKFLSHSVISINLPKGRDPQKVARTIIAMSRKRAHDVRGHWRRDWRHEGNRIWIHEHQRGDASLGFVMHDYKVEHDVARSRA